MILHELHVLQRPASAINQRHAIAGLDGGVGGVWEDATAAACADNHRFRSNRLNAAGHQFDRNYALHAAIVDEQLGDEPLVVAMNLVVLERGLKEGVQNVEAGLISGEPGALLLHSAKGAYRDVAVGLAAPGASPVLKSQELLRRFSYKGLDGILIAEPVAAGDCVVTMVVERVVGLSHTGSAAFGGNGVAAHGIDL